MPVENPNHMRPDHPGMAGHMAQSRDAMAASAFRAAADEGGLTITGQVEPVKPNIPDTESQTPQA